MMTNILINSVLTLFRCNEHSVINVKKYRQNTMRN